MSLDIEKQEATRNIAADDFGEVTDLKDLIARATESGTALEDLIGSEQKNVQESFGIPLLFAYEDDKRLVRYRQRDGVAELFTDANVGNGVWVETDSRMTLKKALKLYGNDLLAFERMHRVTTLQISGMNVRKRVEITTRLLVTKK